MALTKLILAISHNDKALTSLIKVSALYWPLVFDIDYILYHMTHKHLRRDNR